MTNIEYFVVFKFMQRSLGKYMHVIASNNLIKFVAYYLT